MATRIVHNLADLEADMKRNAVEFKPRAAEQVRDTAKDGNEMGKRLARQSSGTHARKYPGTFSAARVKPLTYEWGPRATGQGNLATILEHGTLNGNPPHHDIAQAADVHGADDLQRRINRLVLDRLFW